MAKTKSKKNSARKKSAGKRRSAKKAAVNKSEAIRAFSKSNPKAGPKEIAETLSKKGIKVSAAFVSTVRSTDKKKSGGGKRSGRKARGGRRSGRKAGSVSVDISVLKSAKKLVDDVGGIEQAKAALAQLAQLID